MLCVLTPATASAQSSQQFIIDGLFETESLRVCTVLPTGTVNVSVRSMVDETASLHFNQIRPSERIVFNMGIDSMENHREVAVTDGLYCITGDSSNRMTTMMDLQVSWRP